MFFDLLSLSMGDLYYVSQSLSNRAMFFDKTIRIKLNHWAVSIPFEQGDVFRPVATEKEVNDFYLSQSLSNRAMFFDTEVISLSPYLMVSQSLSNRAMFFDCSGMLEAGIMRPFRPTSQFFWKVKELALDLSK